MLWLSPKVRTAFTACISFAGARGIPKTVYFKSGREAFDRYCKYGKIDPLRNGCIRLGLTVPGASTTDSEGYQLVVVKIADPVTPFLCRGTTAVPNMPPLQGDQLVYWCASRYDPRLCKTVSDLRSCWEGLILGVCAPEMTAATGHFKIMTGYCDYLGR